MVDPNIRDSLTPELFSSDPLWHLFGPNNLLIIYIWNVVGRPEESYSERSCEAGSIFDDDCVSDISPAWQASIFYE